MKVTTIEEAQDIASLKVDELFSSLLTFEMALEGKLEKRNKSVALQSLSKPQIDVSDKESDESLAKSIAFLSKKFNHVLKQFEKRLDNKPTSNPMIKLFKASGAKKDRENYKYHSL